MIPDTAMPAITVQADALPVEVEAGFVEIPSALPDAGDGSTAELIVDDVEP